MRFYVFFRIVCTLSLILSQMIKKIVFLSFIWMVVNPSVFSQTFRSYPFIEDFESDQWEVPLESADFGNIPSEWTRSDVAGYSWRPMQGTDAYPYSGPVYDYSTSFGQYMISFGEGTDSIASLTSPWIDLSSAQQPEYRFAEYRFGAGISRCLLLVQRFGSAHWDTLGNYAGQDKISTVESWNYHSIDVTSFAGDSVRFRYQAIGTGTGLRGVAIDAIHLSEMDTCWVPNNVASPNQNSSGITLTWINPNNDSTYFRVLSRDDSFYSDSIFYVGTGQSYTIYPLKSGTEYMFWGSSACALRNGQPWGNKFVESTPCSYKPTPYLVDFEGGGWQDSIQGLPFGSVGSCWSINGQSVKQWEVTRRHTPLSHSIAPPPNGSRTWIQFEGHDDLAPMLAHLNSPIIQLGSGPQYLSFWYNVQGQNADALRVYVTRFQNNQTTVLEDLLPIQNTTQSTWNRAVIDLSSFANQRVRIFFRGIPLWASTKSSDMVVAIDDFQFSSTPPCSLGVDLGLLTTDFNSATILAKPGASVLRYEYGLKGFSPGLGMTATSINDTVLLSGLTPNTEYEFYALTTCGTDSVWTSALSFSTTCSATKAPYFEDFEGMILVDDVHPVMTNSWVISRGLSLRNACWNLTSPFAGMTFSVGSADRPLGSPNDHTLGNGRYLGLKVQRYLPDPFYSSSILTPAINLDTLSHPELEYSFKLFSQEAIYGDVYVRVYDSVGFVRYKIRSDSLELSSNTLDWRTIRQDLSPFVNQVIRIEFVAIADRSSSGLTDAVYCIDDISIQNSGSCPGVRNLVSSSQTETSVTLEWDSSVNAQWIVTLSEVGSGTAIVDTVYSDSITLTSLNAATRYEVNVKALCVDSTSQEESIIVETECGVLSAPFYENFDDENWVTDLSNHNVYFFGPCWDVTEGALGERNTLPFYNSQGRGDHTSGFGKYWLSQDRAVLSELKSPLIDLSGLNNPELRLWSFYYRNDISDSMHIYVRSLGSSTWTVLGSVSTTSTTSIDFWKESVFDLAGFSNDTIEIRWRGSFAGYGAKFGIDDVSIDEKSDCGTGPSVSLNPLNGTSVGLDWDMSTANEWIIGYGVKGSDPSMFDTIHAYGSPLIVKDLNPWTEYEFRMRSICDSGSVSTWGSPSFFRSNEDGCYYNLKLTSAWTIPSNAVIFTSVSGMDTVVQRFPFHGVDTANFTVYIPDSSHYSITLESAFSDVEMATTSFGLEDPSGFVIWSLANQNVAVTDTTILFSDTSSTCDVDCILPSRLTAHIVEYTSATIGWVSLMDSSEVFIGSVGSVPQPGVYRESFMKVDTLNPSSDYWVFVRDLCADTSWIGPLLIETTRCSSPLASFTYSNVWNDFVFQSDLYNDTDAVSFVWDFGDGNSDSASTPSHSYGASGEYHVQLIYTNLCRQTDTSIQVVRVCDSLYADFVPQLTSGTIVSFDVSNSYGWFAEAHWDFGDGTSSTVMSPNHSFPGFGYYQVSLRLVDSCGNVDSTTQLVSVCATPIGVVQVTSSGFNYTFDGSGSLFSDQFRWNIDGNVFTNSIANYTFTGYGAYTIRFRNWNACNQVQDTSFQVFICAPPSAQWTSTNVSSGSSPLEVLFDASLSIADKYYWDFGDGTTDSSYLVTHTYANPNATYLVELVVESVCGERDTLAKSISYISLKEEMGRTISVYPNPSNGEVFLQFAEGVPANYALSLSSLDGKVISPELVGTVVDENVLSINLNQPKGVYLIVIKSESESWVQRLVIQ